MPRDAMLFGIHLWEWEGDDDSNGLLLSIGLIFLTIDIYL